MKPGHVQNFSLKALLERDMRPSLCRQMLNEIKSPLLEHSFVFTDGNSPQISYDDFYHQPRRPDIPYARRQPNSRYESPCKDLAETMDVEPIRRKSQDVQRNISEEVVSPLHPQVTQKESKRVDAVLEDSNSNFLNLLSSYFVPEESQKRFRIFGSQYLEIHPKTQRKSFKQGYSLSEVIKKLQSNKQKYFANFFIFIQSLAKCLQDLQKNSPGNHQLSGIYQVIARDSTYTPEIVVLNENQAKIFKRLKAKNIYEAIGRMKPVDIREEPIQILPPRLKPQQKQMETIFSILTKMENIISAFLGEVDSMTTLVTVHRYLKAKYPHCKSLHDQILSFLHSFEVYELDDSLIDFVYIWKKFVERPYTEQAFIQELGQNDIIYRDKSKKGFERDLENQGFKRNI